MNRIAVIALNTFRETLRDKILYNLVFFGLLLIGSSILLSTLTMGEQAKIIQDLGLASINLFGVLIAIFVGIGLVSKEIEKRTIYSIIAKPIPRYQFLLGKYFGLTLTLFVNMSIMVVGFFLTLLSGGAGMLVALGLCRLVNMAPMPDRFSGMVLSWQSGLVALATLVVIGVATSTYPARRAAELPPVEALRFEM